MGLQCTQLEDHAGFMDVLMDILEQETEPSVRLASKSSRDTLAKPFATLV
jgi:hypothetical protein